jgi:hypothetical protein
VVVAHSLSSDDSNVRLLLNARPLRLITTSVSSLEW